MFYTTSVCPKCLRNTDLKLLGICSGLGPSATICKCGIALISKRKEWPEMNLSEKGGFIGLSVLGGLAVGTTWGLFTGTLIPGSQNNWQFPHNFTPFGSAFVPGLIFGMFIVCAIQAFRVILSVRRVRDLQGQPPNSTWRDLMGTQFLILLLILLPLPLLYLASGGKAFGK